MDATVIPLFSGEKDYFEKITGSCEKLLAAKGFVSPDGTETVFRVKYSNQPAFNVHFGFQEIGWIEHEVLIARKLMQSRLQLTLDRGVAKLIEVCETALRPDDIEVIIDPFSGDRVFVYQFEHHAPLGIRLAPNDAYRMILRHHNAVKRNRN